MKTYRIRDWDKHYETAETRKLVQLRWLPVPNKHDGLGYRRIAAQKDATNLFTAWILILQVASKGRGPEERGNLLRGQQVLGDEDLAMMTGFPKEIFTRALAFFSDPKMGWLLVHEDELALSPVQPADSPAIPASSPAVWNGMEGMEGKVLNGHTCPPASGKSEFQKRIGSFFRQRESTEWGKKELAAWNANRRVIESTATEDWELLTWFFTIPEAGTYRRKDCGTLMNNWTAEIDRARAHKAKVEPVRDYANPFR